MLKLSVRAIASIIVFLSGLPPPPSWGAEISYEKSTIYIDGELESGDFSKFENLVDSLFTKFNKTNQDSRPILIIRPTSLGGSVQEAMDIGRLVRKNALWVFGFLAV